MVAAIESHIVSWASTLLGALSGMLLGLIVYIWKTNISSLKSEVAAVANNVHEISEEIRRLERDKAAVADMKSLLNDLRNEALANQTRFASLNESLISALAEMRREFVRASDCPQKHSVLEQGNQIVTQQLQEQREMLREIAEKVDQILEWKAFKSGEEQGRKNR